MDGKALLRWGGYCLIVGGLALAIFWLLVIPFESFAGVETATNQLQLIAQDFHVLGAILLVFGFFALYTAHYQNAGKLGALGFVLTILGALGIGVDAIIGLVISPALAVAVPETVAPTGALFTGAILTLYIVIFAVNMIGQLLFGIALWRASDLSRIALALFIVGAIMVNLPPNPALHLVLVAGGVLNGIGTAWLGRSLI